MVPGKAATLCRSRGEPGGAKAHSRSVSMASLALGTVFAFFPGVRSINTACRPLQGTGPLPSLPRRDHRKSFTPTVRSRRFARDDGETHGEKDPKAHLSRGFLSDQGKKHPGDLSNVDRPLCRSSARFHRRALETQRRRTENPEVALRAKLPKQYWIEYNDLLVSFGQHLCRPISPVCSQCPIAKTCNRIGVTMRR